MQIPALHNQRRRTKQLAAVAAADAAAGSRILAT